MRYIKPEFWTDGTLVKCSRDARMLYIGTWNFALCDEGHLDADVMRLKMQVFPMDDVDIEALLRELIDAERIKRITYGPDRRPALHVVHLREHQKTDARWSARCPVCTSLHLSEPPQTSPDPSETRPKVPRRGGEGSRRGMGEEGSKTPSSAAPTTTSEFEQFWSLYPRKVGKQDAIKAFAKATKNASAARVILGAKRLTEDPNLPEKQFVPHPATWLNRGGWEDEPYAPRSTGRPSVPTTDDKVRDGMELAERLRTQHPVLTSPQIGA
ncbi:hypothetical protein [Cellulomonas sp. ES6]|uniref:hypothetical protein n=1 Tax=Cellulomonas sp. ES6 TaxID=3039384 RepID=UPI0024B69CEB|nr:hypothetical protein [Cellulomonas sp. ES6]WHP18818.1 hypothetical protein P9841_06795 [Cellulomonas sp. ES6]